MSHGRTGSALWDREVHGVDFSPEMVSRARAKAARAPDGPGPRPRAGA